MYKLLLSQSFARFIHVIGNYSVSVVARDPSDSPSGKCILMQCLFWRVWTIARSMLSYLELRPCSHEAKQEWYGTSAYYSISVVRQWCKTKARSYNAGVWKMIGIEHGGNAEGGCGGAKG